MEVALVVGGCELLAESGVLGFEVCQALAEGSEAARDFGFGKARGDVLRAIPVEAFNVDDKGAFDDVGGIGGTERLEERGLFGSGLDDLGATEDFEAGLVGVVHEEERDAGVVMEIADRDVLLVAAEIGEGEGSLVEDVQEAGIAAAVLDVGPAGFGDGGHVEAVAEGDEVLLAGAEGMLAGAELLHAGVLSAAAVLLLLGFDVGGEGDVEEGLGHGEPRSLSMIRGAAEGLVHSEFTRSCVSFRNS